MRACSRLLWCCLWKPSSKKPKRSLPCTRVFFVSFAFLHRVFFLFFLFRFFLFVVVFLIALLLCFRLFCCCCYFLQPSGWPKETHHTRVSSLCPSPRSHPTQAYQSWLRRGVRTTDTGKTGGVWLVGEWGGVERWRKILQLTKIFCPGGRGVSFMLWLLVLGGNEEGWVVLLGIVRSPPAHPWFVCSWEGREGEGGTRGKTN